MILMITIAIGFMMRGLSNDGGNVSNHGWHYLGLLFCSNRRNLMTLVVKYPSKKELKQRIGEPLRYIETSLFGPEYRPDGVLTVANRPHITGIGREFFANVTMKDGLIQKVV